ncbi:helix-turn-helix transcriptional regulator [Paenibacillus sp. HJGM_3]|uniref:helix-turn-helix transcriptional regulator n=1 Tax=Paenibacillus sp. HJGM_3 TaxID=3379816 RepID=UPI003858B1DC
MNGFKRRIAASFALMIVLFAIVDVLIVYLVKSHVQADALQMSQLTVEMMAERYQSHFQRVEDVLSREFTDRQVVRLRKQLLAHTDPAMLNTRAVAEEFLRIVGESDLYIDNLILTFRSASLAVDKNGAAQAADLLADYSGEVYSLAYWNTQYERKAEYESHPAVHLSNSRHQTGTMTVIPYSFKPAFADYMLIAMIDADRLRAAMLDEQTDVNATIMGPDRFFRYTTAMDTRELPAILLAGGSPVDVSDDRFPDRSESSLEAVNRGAVGDGSSLSLDQTIAFIVAAEMSLAVLAAYLLGRHIYTPVRQMQLSVSRPFEDLVNVNERNERLKPEQEEVIPIRRNALNWWDGGFADFVESEEHYTIVLYELRFRLAADAGMREDISRAIVGEIERLTGEYVPSSLTYQVEQRRFLSIVPGLACGEIPALLEGLKQIFDRDTRHVLVTVAISPLFGSDIRLNEAYQQLQRILMQARPLEETQILLGAGKSDDDVVWTLQREQKFVAAMMVGDEEELVNLAHVTLEELDLRENSLEAFRRLAGAIIDKTRQLLFHCNLPADRVRQWDLSAERLDLCCTVTEYNEELGAYLKGAASLIKEKKDAEEPVVEQIMKAIQERYMEDLSLDVLAVEFQLSPSYLSTYIKEKTGLNFIEHLHDTRLRNAQLLLLDTDLHIQTIGSQVGYRNISSFNRMFKSRTGLSPSEYRRASMMNRKRLG